MADSWTRRDLLLGGLTRLKQRLAEQPDAPPLPNPVRPPGALPEASFLTTCERCHACIEACPNQVLGAITGRGEAVDGTPQMAFADGYCERCRACAEACPTGAIQPAVEGRAADPGVAEVLTSLCLNQHGFAMCLSCRERCPEAAIQMIHLGLPMVDAERCTGCGACCFVCPTSPRAIEVIAAQRPEPPGAPPA